MIGEQVVERLKRPQYNHVVRFVLAVGSMEFFAFKVLDPYYLQFMTTDRGLNLSPSQFGFFVALASGVTLVIDYITGVFADKFGRRLSWAVSMFLYGGGMLWLSTTNAFGAALLTAAFMGMSYAFVSGAREAWLYDSVGQEGMREALGKVYLYGVPLTIAGAVVATALGLFGSLRLPIALTGVFVLANGIFILTFRENYGSSKRRGWFEIMKVGFHQFLESRILWLTAVQSFFTTLPIWITTAWWVTYLSTDFHVEMTQIALAFGVTSIAAAIAGAYISKMKTTEYTSLIIYPSLLTVGAFLLMPLAPSPAMFVPLVIAAITCGYFRGSGITLLENEQITDERATALSFLSTLRSGFWIIGPIIWGPLISLAGLKAAFVLAGVASFISLVILILVLRIRGGRQ